MLKFTSMMHASFSQSVKFFCLMLVNFQSRFKKHQSNKVATTPHEPWFLKPAICDPTQADGEFWHAQFNLGNPKRMLQVREAFGAAIFQYKNFTGTLPFAWMHFFWLTALHAPVTTQRKFTEQGIVAQGLFSCLKGH